MVFSGTVQSDFMKLVKIPENRKETFVDFAATDFISIRKSLVDYIKAVYPTEYNNFSESDLGMMLIELVSYMGSVMSMKSDMLANENFLRTAKQRDSVRKLLELVGVSMKGPISAAANAKITLDTAPSSFQPADDLVASAITLPISNRVFSIQSPEDGGSLSYTIYKVTNGDLGNLTVNGDIQLYASDADNPTATSSVFTNIAILEGVLITETGQFSNLDTTKSVTLTQGPVVQNSVEVFLTTGKSSTSGVWRRVDNLYSASGASDRIFQVVHNNNYGATVVFGDGISGAIPDMNSVYFITYRIGGGTRGNIANEVINIPITLLEAQSAGFAVAGNNIAGTLENTSIGTGGSNAETIAHAKRYAPLTFKRQDRVVTLEDYIAFANSFVSPLGSTGKATALLREGFSSGNIVDIIVLERASTFQMKKASLAYKKALLEELEKKRLVTVQPVLVDGLIRTVDLVITITIEEELRTREEQIKGAISFVILDYFNVDNWDFGKTLFLGDLNRAIFAVNDVRMSKIENFDEDQQVNHHEIIQLNNFEINVDYI